MAALAGMVSFPTLGLEGSNLSHATSFEVAQVEMQRQIVWSS